MKRKAVILPSIILVPILFVYLLFPLENDNFEILKDENSYIQKKQFLDEEVSGSADSLKPNILWILVDDLGMADTDLYEAGPVKVPHMNNLARQGVKFTNAYVSSPVCSPSRASIATGRYNQRFGFENQMHERYLRNRIEYYAFRYIIDSYPWRPKYQTEVPNEDFLKTMGLPESEITAAEILKKYDYSTGYIGKWHLGKQANKSPNSFGFDHFYGFYSSHSLYSPENTPEIVDQKISEDFTDDYIWEGQRDGLQAIRVNGQEITESRYLTTAITDESINFIKSNKDKPFYLWTSFNAPHTPLQAPEAYVNMYLDEPDPVKRVHYAMIKSLDDEIGRLLDFLDSEGLSNNTLVILLSDNGGAEYNLTTNNGPYQGGKITNFEGGVKVPMVMRWPDHLPVNMVYENPVHSSDLLVTSVINAGADLPADRGYDGSDLVEHINSNTIPHKYIYHKMGSNSGIRNLEFKMTWNEVNGDTLLFHLTRDPYEQENLYSSDLEVVKDLQSAFNEWVSKNTPPLWPSMIYYHYRGDDGREYFFDE